MDMNMSFLAKWVWRFGNEANVLWRWVLNAKYGVSDRELSWNWGGGSSPSLFVKAVRSLFEEGSKTGKILQNGMKCIHIHREVADALAWAYNSNGTFSVRSFQSCLEKDEAESLEFPNILWQGICPPKIEVFAWQLSKGRIMVRQRLHRVTNGVLQSKQCVLCNLEDETVDHLFLHCKWTWELWLKGMSWWIVSCCPSKSVIEWMNGWSGLCPKNSYARAWCLLFFAIVWIVWEVRNRMVFNGKMTL
ncbi:hypothetical protein Ddye_001491 [Dipteronia dyeriana]|uniref:Reverse transcriptase zinc-binding domain-containing protein n=1 Tax=Dipteronia dyeriana TaxID=168575 RepID=A0AAD9XP52_9ROSI|nr:hypothetical protein Ddye_001491 [Dipteronia dyeriana]